VTMQLEMWLKRATLHLSRDAVAQVRTEISEHYDDALESATAGGASVDEGDHVAMAALGDAGVANREYRKVLLTSGEARLLREGNWEARAIGSHRWLKHLLVAMPAAAVLGGLVLLLAGATGVAQVLLAGGLGIGIVFAGTLLPMYTAGRSLAFRIVKWTVLAGILVLAFWPLGLQWSWLLVSCLWPMAWAEWTRASIRRKLPVTKWPKQLYM